ncbi:MAG: hypothetical protein QXD58_00420 [Candidatus Micrarchaeaceae archaeon]
MAVAGVNFLDLACLTRIAPDTTVEKFGSVINSSFYDVANITGTLKQKGLVDFTSNYPGPNGLLITDAGKQLLAEADAKSTEAFDEFDSEILRQLSGGKRLPDELAAALNINSKDLALRLYKLYKQEYIIFDIKNGVVELTLTEKGFLKVKGMPQAAPQAQATPAGQQQQAPLAEKGMQAQQQVPSQVKRSSNVIKFVVVIIVVILLLVVLYYKGFI